MKVYVPLQTGEVKEIQVWFEHVNEPDEKATTCIIYQGEEVWGVGNAYCNPQDQYCKALGRQIALKRAVEDAFPNTGCSGTRTYADARLRDTIYRNYLETHKVV